MMPPSSFLAGHLLLGSQPTRKSSLFPVEKKQNFHFASGYKLEIASGLGMGHLSTCPSALGPHLVHTCAGPVRAASVSVSPYVHQACCV